jgi:hypothetical protein
MASFSVSLYLRGRGRGVNAKPIDRESKGLSTNITHEDTIILGTDVNLDEDGGKLTI